LQLFGHDQHVKLTGPDLDDHVRKHATGQKILILHPRDPREPRLGNDRWIKLLGNHHDSGTSLVPRH
jgi:hypothetical protein